MFIGGTAATAAPASVVEPEEFTDLTGRVVVKELKLSYHNPEVDYVLYIYIHTYMPMIP